MGLILLAWCPKNKKRFHFQKALILFKLQVPPLGSLIGERTKFEGY